jgi:cell cycle serine/threonine-protein kinase CDC5/MSD2
VTHIDKNYTLTRWTLSEVMALALSSPDKDPEKAKFHQRLVDKLKYCKEVLGSIRNASAQSTVEHNLESKASKASLR